MPHNLNRSAAVVVLALTCLVLGGCGSSGSSAQSSAPSKPTLHLVALGDSIPFGQHFCGNCGTFDDLYAAHLRHTANAKVTVQNLSQATEITSADLRREMNSDASMRAAVAQADIVTVSVGHNDTPWNSFTDSCDGHGGYPNADWASYRGRCVAKTAAEYGRNLASVLAAITVLRAGKPTLIMVTNDYDDIIGDPVVPASADPGVARVVDAFAGTTCRMATAHHAVCIDTYHAFNGPTGRGDATELLEGDHTHPNESGHQLIAHLLAQVPTEQIAPG
jgi:lysophospholipase L1-like esterase